MKRALLLVTLVALAACKADDPPASPDGPPRPDGAIADAGPDAPPVDANPSCEPLPTDYAPGAPGADDTWPACISDDATYHPFDASISTIARVAAFEQIAALLFTGAPSAQDFTDARVLYVQDQGLESRVVRREDEHYPPLSSGLCSDPATAAANPDRCVGPARLTPLLQDAFALGEDAASTPLDRRIAAARIEAGLLWFLYVSTFKEAITCTNVPRDCDSSYAYYTGGEAQDGGLGLARYVRALDVATHDRVWDGILAVRCWRDLDNPTGVATDLAMRDRATAQMDRAALRGLSLIVRDRALAVDQVRWEFLRVLGPVLDRDATLRDAALAADLRAEFAKTDWTTVDAAAIVAALDALYPCP